MKAIVEFAIGNKVDFIVFPSVKKAKEASFALMHVLSIPYSENKDKLSGFGARKNHRLAMHSGERWICISLLDGVNRGSYASTQPFKVS